MFDDLPPSAVGLALDLVGVIFLGNSMGIRHPRRFVNEHFGVDQPQPLAAVQQRIRVKAQIFCGFLFLILGLSLGFVGAVVDPGGGGEAPSGVGRAAQMLVVLVVLVGGLTALLRLGQEAWSRRVFKRLLREFFQDHQDWSFEKRPSETLEIGEILGVPRQGEDSIGDYAGRVRAALGLTGDSRDGARSPADAFAPLRRRGVDRRS